MNNSDGALRHFRELTPEELTTVDGGRRTRTERRSDRENRRSERREQRSDRRDARQERREERGSTRNGGGKSGWSTLTQVFSFDAGNGRGGLPQQAEQQRPGTVSGLGIEDLAKKPWSQRKRLALAAERLGGIPYTWGEASAKGADCSGSVDFQLRGLGYTGPRYTADEQFDHLLKEIPSSVAGMGDFRLIDANNDGTMDHIQALTRNGRSQFTGGRDDNGRPSVHFEGFGVRGPYTSGGGRVYYGRLRPEVLR